VLQEADAETTEALQASLAVAGATNKATSLSAGTLSLTVLSRWPITSVIDTERPGSKDLLADRWDENVNPMLAVTVETPSGPLHLANVHLSAPRSGDLVKRRQAEYPLLADQFSAWEKESRSSGRPHVVAGDFNSSHAHADFRNFLSTGYTDAHRRVGCGVGTTWSPFGAGPGILAVDHVLVSDEVTLTAHESLGYAGSDHRASLVSFEID